jgi:3-methyladenine DNA glycosylase AlkD
MGGPGRAERKRRMAVQTATVNEMMKELMVWTSAQNVKVYRKHGAGDDLYGVSFTDLRKLARRIRTDHVLALELWESGNVDARLLAAMIADPAELTPAIIDQWLEAVDYYMISDELAELISRSPIALEVMTRLMTSTREYHRACGYTALASALKNGVDVPDQDCRGYLFIIEEEIHTSPNRARHSMNNAVIAIGIYKPALTEEAMAAASRIGKVVVDHGDTACKTPDAFTYIEKNLARRK